jgi:hypothetical protein
MTISTFLPLFDPEFRARDGTAPNSAAQSPHHCFEFNCQTQPRLGGFAKASIPDRASDRLFIIVKSAVTSESWYKLYRPQQYCLHQHRCPDHVFSDHCYFDH